jgi:hypothetical protein
MLKIEPTYSRLWSVVKNEGEPGGPFWVQDDKGDISLVESSQVNIDVAEQASITAASHFNPRFECAESKFQREKFDLNSYVDKTVALL